MTTAQLYPSSPSPCLAHLVWLAEARGIIARTPEQISELTGVAYKVAVRMMSEYKKYVGIM